MACIGIPGLKDSKKEATVHVHWGGGGGGRGWLLCCKVVSGAPRTEAPPKASISHHGYQSQRRRQLSRATSLSFVEEALCEMSLATDDMFASL